jgi:5-methylcytosine-specific restriction endonuclease McrA
MAAQWHGRKGRPWRRIRAEVLASSDICWLCLRPGANTVDHVLPLSLYPELAHDRSNLAPAHHSCNSSKGASTTRSSTASSRRW